MLFIEVVHKFDGQRFKKINWKRFENKINLGNEIKNIIFFISRRCRLLVNTVVHHYYFSSHFSFM